MASIDEKRVCEREKKIRAYKIACIFGYDTSIRVLHTANRNRVNKDHFTSINSTEYFDFFFVLECTQLLKT